MGRGIGIETEEKRGSGVENGLEIMLGNGREMGVECGRIMGQECGRIMEQGYGRTIGLECRRIIV
ncbi:hypothetical protein [Clostridium sp. 1001271st1 H5]|uniref:hypothetical protein n=1 Tax=unclassified Clostridium TaxID=2614128 RepID=UPI0014870416|nr:hypothetical protein [Clostridium sp. 1001271st1 H5]